MRWDTQKVRVCYANEGKLRMVKKKRKSQQQKISNDILTKQDNL